MIIDREYQQGSMAWLEARLGNVTASCMGNIVTSTGKVSASQRAYAFKLAAEAHRGRPLDDWKSLDMFLGNSLEDEGRALYTLLTGNRVHQAGMVWIDDDRRVGGSPDGLIDDVGVLEVKSVKPNTQAEYLYTGGVPAKYRPQVYGLLYVSGFDWCDFLSHSPDMPPHLVRTTRDDEGYERYAEALYDELPKFLNLLTEITEAIEAAN